MPSANQIAQEVISAAQRALPQERAGVLRQGAVHFAQLSNQATNPKAKDALARIGLDFAQAAMEWPQKSISQDDFSGLLQEVMQATVAAEEAGVAPQNLAMDAFAARLEMNPGMNAPGGQSASRISVNPATFTKDTTLGRYTTVKFNPTSEEIARGVSQQATVALWQGNKIESQAMTVDVGLIFPPVPPPTKGVFGRPFASIQYGADGNVQNLVTIDIGLGKRITVVGNFIAVIVGMDPPPLGTDSIEMTLGASIGAFAAPTAAPIIRTVYADNLVPNATFGQSKLFNVPLRATRLFPPLLLTDDTITITFCNIVGIPISQWVCTYSAVTRFQVPVVVPGDAFFFTIQMTQAPNADIRVPFELSL